MFKAPPPAKKNKTKTKKKIVKNKALFSGRAEITFTFAYKSL